MPNNCVRPSSRPASSRSLFAVALCLLMATSFSLVAAPEPIAHWSMEKIEGGIVPDITGHGHDATAHGKDNQLPQIVDGITGHALRFSAKSQQYLQVNKFGDLAAPEAFTIMAWIQPLSRNAAYEIICSKGDRSGEGPWPGWRFRYFWTRALFQFGTADGKEPSASTASWTVEVGFWSHAAATYDGKNVSLYVNCNLLVTKEINERIMPSPRAFIIANYIGRKDAYAFDGIIDELKVFGKVLTEAEIFAEATRGMAQ